MAKKKVVKKKPAAKKAAKQAAKKAGKKPVSIKKKPVSIKKKPSLGRPVVTAEEDLDMLFKGDYHARQIFEFLRVKTVGELEQFSPQEIVKRLSRPVVESVDRVRRTLAEKNRCLFGDLDFALEHKQRQAGEAEA